MPYRFDKKAIPPNPSGTYLVFPLKCHVHYPSQYPIIMLLYTTIYQKQIFEESVYINIFPIKTLCYTVF